MTLISVKREPDTDIVNQLQHMLQKAEAGEIIALAGATVDVDGMTSQFRVYNDYQVRLLGSLHLCAAGIANDREN